MIVPNKHVTVRDSLLGVGALILDRLEKPMTVSELWGFAREADEVATFERFTLALDMLFMLEAIAFSNNKLRRVSE